MKLRKILKENSVYIHLDKGHPNAKPHTWGGSSLNENDYNIKKIVRAIKAKKVNPDLVSPNYVADVADEKKIQLSSTDIVYISDNYEKLLKEETAKKIGDSFSNFYKTLKLTASLSTQYGQNVESLWKDEKSNKLFGFYTYSGLREITPRLYNELMNSGYVVVSEDTVKDATPKKRKLLFGQEDKNEIELTDEIKQKFFEAVKSFNKYGESIYRESKLKDAMEEICEIGKLAEKVTLSETGDWFDSISVQKDMKNLNEDIKLFEKTCNEVNQLQQRLESCFESIGHKLNKYYDIQDNEQIQGKVHENKINRKLNEEQYYGADIVGDLTINDFGDEVKKINDLMSNQDYIIKDYGLNQWIGYMNYLGMISGEHKFKSSYQNDDFKISFKPAELFELIQDGGIVEQLD